MKVYEHGGPQVLRVSYGYAFEQFDILDEALIYLEKQLNFREKHSFLIQKVNLKGRK